MKGVDDNQHSFYKTASPLERQQRLKSSRLQSFVDTKHRKKFVSKKEKQETFKLSTCQRILNNNKTINSTTTLIRINLKSFIFTQSLISITIYIIMIEGLGKGVKYALFVANAIIFVSIDTIIISLLYILSSSILINKSLSNTI